MVEVTGYLKLD